MRLGVCSLCQHNCYVEKPCCDEPVLYNGSYSAYFVSTGKKWDFPIRTKLPVSNIPKPPEKIDESKVGLRLIIGGRK